MSEHIWSFGENPYYKFTKNSSAHSNFFKFGGGIEVQEGGIYLTDTELQLGDIAIKLSDIDDFRLVFLPDRRLFELELKPGYPEKYVYIASYRSTKGVMSGSFEMIYLFSYLCKLLDPKTRDYRLAMHDVDVEVTYDKPVYGKGEKVVAKLKLGKKMPKMTTGIDLSIASSISTWKSEGVIVQGHTYHHEYTSTQSLGKKSAELTNDKIEKAIELEYELPKKPILPMLNSHGRPFEITHEVTVRFKRRFLQDIYARYLIPYLPKIDIHLPAPVTVSDDGITASLDRNVVRSKETVEIDVKLDKDLIYDSIRVEFLRKIDYRVFKHDPNKTTIKIDTLSDTDTYSLESDFCMFEVSKVTNFPLNLTIPHEVFPSYNEDPLVKFGYYIRVVFVRKLARDHKVDVPITFYPNWRDFID